jgi:hypothetical protein
MYLDKMEKLDRIIKGIFTKYDNALRRLSDKEEKPMCKDYEATGTLLNFIVNKKIKDRVINGEIFSAWDITQSIRKEVGPKYNISHADVRNVVNDWFEEDIAGDGDSSGYVKSLCNLKNGKVTNLYHSPFVSLKSYNGYTSCVNPFSDRKADFKEPEDKNSDLCSECGGTGEATGFPKNQPCPSCSVNGCEDDEEEDEDTITINESELDSIENAYHELAYMVERFIEGEVTTNDLRKTIRENDEVIDSLIY